MNEEKIVVIQEVQRDPKTDEIIPLILSRYPKRTNPYSRFPSSRRALRKA